MYSFNRKKVVVNSTTKKSIQDLPIAQLSRDWDDTYAEAMAKAQQDPKLEPDECKSLAKAQANLKVAEWAAAWGVKTLPWFWPQVLAHISRWEYDTIEGQPDPKSLLVKNCRTDHFNKGLYRLCMYTKRSDLVAKQSSGDDRYYCALVPLVLAAHKKYNNVPYSSWRSQGLELVVEEKLYEAMHQVLEASPQDILEARNVGLLIKSGDKRGGYRSTLTTYMLYGVGHTVLAPLNSLAQVMYTQIWCAHPTNRNPYMILDPDNWDGTPPDLIEGEPLAPKPKPLQPATSYSDIDW